MATSEIGALMVLPAMREASFGRAQDVLLTRRN